MIRTLNRRRRARMLSFRLSLASSTIGSGKGELYRRLFEAVKLARPC
jgi:hypothetical protein